MGNAYLKMVGTIFTKLHSFKQGEAGNVYVYKTNVRGHVTTMELMNQNLPRNEQSGARFGATLASLGNLDGDGLEDFAVGAPHENNGAGAIYVYRGSRSFVFSGNTNSFLCIFVHYQDSQSCAVVFQKSPKS